MLWYQHVKRDLRYAGSEYEQAGCATRGAAQL